MSLETVQPAGHTQKAVKELQSFRVEAMAGGAAATKFDIAAIRADDILLSVVDLDTGAFADETANTVISDIRASGTLTLVSVVADDTAVVNGVTYTFKVAPGAAHTEVLIGADDTADAANLAAAINAVEQSPGQDNEFVATSALGVVTITARAEGAAGNAITTVAAPATITASAATLEGGSDTGGIECSNTTAQLLVFWYKNQD